VIDCDETSVLSMKNTAPRARRRQARCIVNETGDGENFQLHGRLESTQVAQAPATIFSTGILMLRYVISSVSVTGEMPMGGLNFNFYNRPVGDGTVRHRCI
jgi:hypothetical protein